MWNTCLATLYKFIENSIIPERVKWDKIYVLLFFIIIAIFVHLLRNEFFRQILVKLPNINFHKIPFRGTKDAPCARNMLQMDRWADERTC